MTNFSPRQIRALTGKLDRSHVHTRTVEGRDIAYIEGWFAIAEANAIFGFGGWDREMIHFERVYERSRGDVRQRVPFGPASRSYKNFKRHG